MLFFLQSALSLVVSLLSDADLWSGAVAADSGPDGGDRKAGFSSSSAETAAWNLISEEKQSSVPTRFRFFSCGFY